MMTTCFSVDRQRDYPLKKAHLNVELRRMAESVPFETFTELSTHRVAIDTAIESWVKQIPADFLASTMRYRNSKGIERAHPVWQAMTHFFNHQTHHRGQITTLLTQAGIDVGTTDLMALI